MPVPMMLAITMEHAVRKPTLLWDFPHSVLECSATVFIAVSTIAELAEAANGLEFKLEFMLAIGWRSYNRGLTEARLQRVAVLLSCQKSFPASVCK